MTDRRRYPADGIADQPHAVRYRLGYLPVVLYDQNITASAGQHAQATWANARQFRRMQFHRRNSKLKGSVGDDFRIDPNLAGERGSSAKRPPSFKRLSRPDQPLDDLLELLEHPRLLDERAITESFASLRDAHIRACVQ